MKTTLVKLAALTLAAAALSSCAHQPDGSVYPYSAQGSDGLPQIGLIPTMKPLLEQ